MVLFDVDGIFTDGCVYLDKNGDEMLKFSRIDGKGIELIRNRFIIGVISSEDSEVIRNRMKKLQLNEIMVGVKNKLECYTKLKEKYNLTDEEILYAGDDVQDIEILKKCGVSCCPYNAIDGVKNICDIISKYKGGEGFVRDICELLIRCENYERNKNRQ